MNQQEFIKTMNTFGKQGVPFFFMINFLKTEAEIYPLSELPETIRYQLNTQKKSSTQTIELEKKPISFAEYQKKFNLVHEAILRGDSYLLNLTQPTAIKTKTSLPFIFENSHAKFKLLTENFVCFSPERFIKIQDNKIFSYPMKGTIDATIPDAEKRILSDEKEAAEHATIVDLIRNDLSQIAENVTVSRYRYIDTIQTPQKTLLQVSSEIVGDLPDDYTARLGTIFDALLPAGSICGAPKPKTLELILRAEEYDRNYYTGVFGIFDGKNLDSAVMIRFIENINGDLYYKSGGGITSKSNAESEYRELLQKIYVPIC
ncbi:aminodeoxychorismate synthase component I [Weeksella virosa]|uniref:Aminodeoxychorismate synthase n=1 Tax=Weeksella virosa (strain ATCC 43766 / DSM 16922 / JCM 21250 / CCUG 30538 / CDC 9751 / IAM 14551 / NBRC 16016 / NCTC 11634 / CL345/78) TaxID=865938 RepID=F0P2J9_WEEVC|nr:aminodeoxychorismate synthase component I [Weeksella virosa]ADX67838.1 Aminodeoxychorismate synthase [Weeksella virosa DSM 16922]MDK7674439.1 aminodeoxychorismate synthase component I [Weeksella virosa]VEH64535.1 Para-aminobenzoate synthase component 1 [Weeksella virosa]